MSTNGVVQEPRSAASKLFDLFRDRDTFEIKDGEGNVLETVTYQALDWQQNTVASRALDLSRIRVRQELETNGTLRQFMDQIIAMPIERVIASILDYERPTAQATADLAPNAEGGDAKDAEKKEDDAVAKWESARRKELEATDPAEVREKLLERHQDMIVNARGIDDWINEALAMQIIDPKTGDRVFSADRTAPNYIGNLMPELRQQLITFQREFTKKRSDKNIRKAAEQKDFLSSGESPKPDTDSPGETTETPRRSRRTPSSSTTVDAGSTTPQK